MKIKDKPISKKECIDLLEKKYAFYLKLFYKDIEKEELEWRSAQFNGFIEGILKEGEYKLIISDKPYVLRKSETVFKEFKKNLIKNNGSKFGEILLSEMFQKKRSKKNWFSYAERIVNFSISLIGLIMSFLQ